MKQYLSIHIYKTAGSTLHSIISRQYAEDEIVFANLIGIEQTKFDLEKGDVWDINKVKIIHGHFPFGWHTFLGENFRYITFVRNPTERLLSDYRYNRSNPNGHYYRFVNGCSLNEYLSDERLITVDNGITRFISGHMDVPYGGLTEESVKIALMNIDQYFDFIGVSEYFDESLLLAKKILGWKRVYYKILNRSIKSTIQAPPEEEINEILNERTKYDRVLYEYICRRFNECLLEYRINKGQIMRLKFLIRLYSWFYPVRKIFFIKFKL